MNIENLPVIKDKAEFFANAELLVQESLEWYGQLADSMELHNNIEASAQFRELEDMEKQQLRWIEQQAAGLTLPEIAPWDFAWDRYNDPDKDHLCDVDYLTTPAEALIAALHSEKHAEKLYRHVAERALDPDVKSIAEEMADLQLHEIKLLQQRLDEMQKEGYDLAEDMDPPNAPE